MQEKPTFNPTDVFDVKTVSGIGAYEEASEKDRYLYKKDDKVFLVVHKNTFEVRTDAGLKKLLTEKYASVMESRYFGRGGLEIVLAGAELPMDELHDLVRLSYNLT